MVIKNNNVQEKVRRRNSGYVYDELLDNVRKEISSGGLGPSDYLPGENALANEYGISRRAVREALDILVRERLVEKVPGKGTKIIGGAYDSSEKTILTIEVIVDTTCHFERNYYALNIIQSLKQAAPEMAIEIELNFKFLEFNGNQSEGCIAVSGSAADAILVLSFSRQCSDFLEKFDPSGLNLICVGRKIESDLIPQVFVNHDVGIEKMTKYLLQLGHREIMAVAPPAPAVLYSAARQKKFVEIMEEFGCDDPKRLIAEVDLDDIAIKKAVSDYFNVPEKPSAILVFSGLWIDAVKHALMDMGKRIPDDVSLVMYDDMRDFSGTPASITAIRQPFEMIARKVLQSVVSKCLMNVDIPVRQDVLPELIVRESCKEEAGQ